MTRRVLRGRVVTMAGRVIDDGCVYLDGNRIEAVQAAVLSPGQTPPAGYAGAPRIDLPGCDLLPGLMDLHNHPPYNVLPAWKVPRRFDGRSQWLSDPDYHRWVRAPADLIEAKDAAVHRALARYVEVKAMLGGATTLQGLSSSHGPYRGLIRNLEIAGGVALPAISTQVMDLTVSKVPSFKTKLAGSHRLFMHLAEGEIQARAQVQLMRDHDLLRPNLVCIHCLGLDAADHAALDEAGARVVWSPLSNLLLYGRTLQPGRLREPFALACDWTPSGSRNLLLELKVAWLWDRQQAAHQRLGAERLAQAVTCDAAQVCGWPALGRLDAGQLADCLVLRRQDADPYLNLIRATERDVLLVLVDGLPHCGDPALMAHWWPAAALETLQVGGKTRALYLPNGASLQECRTLLASVMSDLTAPAPALPMAAMAALGAGDDFRLRFDMNEADEGRAADVSLMSAALLAPVTRLPLDALTVVDDLTVLDAVAALAHVPAFLKGNALRAFYAG